MRRQRNKNFVKESLSSNNNNNNNNNLNYKNKRQDINSYSSSATSTWYGATVCKYKCKYFLLFLFCCSVFVIGKTHLCYNFKQIDKNAKASPYFVNCQKC